MAQISSGLQLQRSAVSFRRQGSSGLVWNDRFATDDDNNNERTSSKPRFYSGELLTRTNKPQELQQMTRRHIKDELLSSMSPPASLKPIKTGRSNQADGNNDPPSPRLKGCGCCAGLGKTPRSGRAVRPVRSRTR